MSVKFPPDAKLRQNGEAERSSGPMKDEGKVITVRGPISADELGKCFTHEHILWDARGPYWVEPEDPELIALGNSCITLEKRGLLQRNCMQIKDNFVQDSVSVAVAEVSDFKKSGGQTLVECSCIGLNGNPAGLRQVSEESGVHIVACTGYYIESGHPAWIKDKSIDELAEILVGHIEEGIGDSGVRAGAMGDVGTTGTVTPEEERTLRACARAQKATGVPLGIHVDPSQKEGMRVLEILFDEEVRPDRICLQHMDEQADADYHLKIAATGVWMEFDTWGSEFYYGAPYYTPEPRDIDRAKCLKVLIDNGHIDQLLMSQDVWLKQLLKRWGGEGYDSLFRYGIPRLLMTGVTEEQISKMILDNPARYLPVS